MKCVLLPGRLMATLATGLLALPGCELSCPPNMTAPPQFNLAFSTDTLAGTGLGFRRAEVRSAYLVRYATADFRQPTDTLRQLTTPLPGGSTKAFLSIYYPSGHAPEFGLPDGYSGISYRLLVPAASRTYDISNVKLAQEPGEKRCDGYRVTKREATINGQARDGLNNTPELTK